MGLKSFILPEDQLKELEAMSEAMYHKCESLGVPLYVAFVAARSEEGASIKQTAYLGVEGEKNDPTIRSLVTCL